MANTKEPNRLSKESSPYLLQHATNPVDWYPWSEEAFAAAKREDKPIFLSVGYSTCHWCHVMERESFEDEAVAELLNAHFINIKVDREERPDIDAVYMAVTQAMTGRGGWPMTVMMTPEKKPFFAGTYFPKESRSNHIGMLDLLPQVAKLWVEDREKVLASADQITQSIRQGEQTAGREPIGVEELEKATDLLKQSYDEAHGGFGGAPKFPVPHQLIFLLRRYAVTGDENLLKIVEHTLRAMRQGGIYDQLGYGFHRYSTDERWLLPHFEKMLYDQALHTLAYLEAYQVTRKEEYATIAREILTYVERDMTSPEGGFYSAEDADSEGEEGKFYVWEESELIAVLGEELAAIVLPIWEVRSKGNFVDEATREVPGTNILHQRRSLEQWAKERKKSVEELESLLESARKKLTAVREKRVHPLKDDKVLTDWNGLMIAACARAGWVLGEERYVAMARKAADFVLDNLRDGEGRLLKRYRQGQAALPGHLEDYAFMSWGLIELYQVTAHAAYLDAAIALMERCVEEFWDEDQGGFFLSGDETERLIVRTREIYDGAIPSGNSVAAAMLLQLSQMTDRSDFRGLFDKHLMAFAQRVEKYPAGYCFYLQAVERSLQPSAQVVVVGEWRSADVVAMRRAIAREYLPHVVVLFRPADEVRAQPHIDRIPFLEPMQSMGGKATAFVCEHFACQMPTNDVDQMLRQLGRTPHEP